MEYEVYIIKDLFTFPQVLKKYPDSILFANLGDGMPEQEWENWLRKTMSNPAFPGLGVGVISQITDPALKAKYIGEVKVNCGFITLKSGPELALKQVSAVLTAAGARGGRKFIALSIGEGQNVTVNLPVRGVYFNGVVKDISSASFSCVFKDDPNLGPKTVFPDIQLKLQAQLLKTEAIALGSRPTGDSRQYVFAFTARVDPDARARIRSYIQRCLQARLDAELAEAEAEDPLALENLKKV